jgi:AraC family transcriptional regulator of adaptative response / DNA-3-methyladenine glycosylase II
LKRGSATSSVRPCSTADSPAGNLQLDPAFCWQAVYSRDRRFDGRFFAGIATTGVYCRPICPVSFGHPESVQWFQSAATAEAAGFRPCGRCRPETSPGSSAWFGTWAVVSRSLKLIAEGALDSGNLEQLAERVGIGSRHLRRLFQQHLGVSPLKIARSHRVLIAKNLIVDSRLPFTEIARGTGFRSIRQFNHSVRTAFDRSPTALRRLHGTAPVRDPLGGIVVHLPYCPPFDWPSLVEFFKSRAIPGVESVEDEIYRRTVEVGGISGTIEVRHEADHARLSMRVVLPGCDRLMQVVQRARRLFDLGADALHIGSYLARDTRLAAMVIARPGLRVPGAWDGFELAVLAILGQNLAGADWSPVTGAFVKTFGRSLEAATPDLTHLFPAPETLAAANLESIGVSPQHACAIRALASAVMTGSITFDSANGARAAAARVRSIAGMDDEATAYITMRASGDPDAFCCTDLASRTALSAHGNPVSPEEVARIFEAYRPWRAYAAMHLWIAARHSAARKSPSIAARKSNARSIRRRSRASRRLLIRS